MSIITNAEAYEAKLKELFEENGLDAIFIGTTNSGSGVESKVCVKAETSDSNGVVERWKLILDGSYVVTSEDGKQLDFSKKANEIFNEIVKNRKS